jgi:D-alanine--poly(phosphoribitol) ligase subunit 1
MSDLPDPFDLFRIAAERHGARPAVHEKGGDLSYAELMDRVRRLGARLARADDAHPRVAILLPQGAWAYAAMFASLMAGGVYVPLNLQMPPEKINRVLDLVDPHVIVSSAATETGFVGAAHKPKITLVEDLAEDRLDDARPANDLAYVIFTSGSTGDPKGVMIGRESLTHYIRWAHDAMAVTPEDRWSQHPNIAFDLSVLDIYGALCAGACLYPMVSRRDRLMPAKAIKTYGLTIWNSVPSVVDLMSQGGQLTEENLGSLRLATFCGEPLLASHLESLFAAKPSLDVHNTYGPTEATVSFTLLKLTKETFAGHCRASVAIGAAIPGMHLLLAGNTEDEGEIVAVGPQVARGYWKDPAQTKDRFFKTEIGGKTMSAYRTGDWGKRVDGDLYFESRIDRQIKRAGFRLELGEIEAAIRSAGAPATCAIHVDGEIIAFLEGEDPGLCDRVAARIGDYLPAYAIPDRFELIAALPRNANDKIDAGALAKRLELQAVS